ncbi:Fe(3+)-hydroxamate ABC transporter permease FhuB [Candidatus Fukatsuia symbiotica]|uniref:Fe3+-hydroxamate ABC transporter permease FhuB n=1 Tax=Candidatus Fukatsuia symbiotica TaxID=1878942 RepID=A0A2U8I3I2_9GAMM|nr:Fe(3+)-hydroxamate ABC transporter permease FhuB [Candidatus Fukatsuia symbiotica]AWK13687.1 Fe3+-hydroxamate ABC transporter permease FhuB [Candidatus Fukatsuia symbiotica]MEA9445517.1 Fe(3+)-hydroxamate ABC transporter permease FhuB [Candidatus Fukatsuia symbiotica]
MSVNIKIWLLPILLALPALALTLYNMQYQLPFSLWWQAMTAPDINNISQIVMHYSILPRSVVSLLVGAGLGLAGLLFQQVLKNPLAEPATLGVSAGAKLGITAAILLAVPSDSWMMSIAALSGAILVALMVIGLSWGKQISPVTLILAGLVMGLYCGALNSLIALFNHEKLQSMFVWASGALNQHDWHNVTGLIFLLLVALILSALLIRPLTLLGIDDGIAKNLGLRLKCARLAALALAVLISSEIVNAVGVIGFIGLFSPLLARICGARRLTQRIVLAPLIGALLLWLTDQVVQSLAHVWHDIPTGSATALVGAPVLLLFLPKLLTNANLPTVRQGYYVAKGHNHVFSWITIGIAILVLTFVVALLFGRGSNGWFWAQGKQIQELLPWRLPRVIAALAAGMMLGVAGSLIQKLTINPMASPEVLGISSGAALGVLVLMMLVSENTIVWFLPAGSIGAALTLLLVMVVAGRRNGFSAQRMLLAGIAVSTVFTTLVVMILASGDPRTGILLAWLAGSTYNVSAAQAWRTLILAVILIATTPLCRRWLVLLPLGTVTAKAVGMALAQSRIIILLIASSLTAAATLMTGPLSFVGLMAPHMARLLGFKRAMPQLTIAALIGGVLMMFADWSGRMVMFPYQIPAGLLATLIGVPYFILLLRKQDK